MAADGSVIIDTRIDTEGINTGVKRINSSFDRLSGTIKKIGTIVATAFAVGQIAQFGKECIELGSDLQEVQNVVDVTFTTMSDKVDQFAKDAMRSAGLSETMAKRYVGTFGAMSKSFGFSEDQAYNMSKALTQLTGDVASFYNISQDEAYTKLKSVFTGETESLKELGVVMTENALNQYALANGFGKTTNAMTEQEKVALRLSFVQNQLSSASGDFIRTSDSWANQVRVMQLQIKSLKATIGQGLINIFTPVIKVINILLSKLATLANAFKSFTELITGKKTTGSSNSGAGGIGTASIQDTSNGYAQASENAEKLADATNDTAVATKKANKETKKYLSSLDEIHKFTSEDDRIDSGGTGGSGNTDGGVPNLGENVDYGSLAQGETVIDKISESAQKLADILKSLWKPFQEAWKKEGAATIKSAQKALKNIGNLAKSVGKSMMSVWTNGTGTKMLSTMLQIGQNVLKTVGNIAMQLEIAWNKNEVGTAIIQAIADAFQKVLDFVKRITKSTSEWAAELDFYPLLVSIKNLIESLSPIIEAIGDFLADLYENIVLPFLKWLIETALPLIINAVSAIFSFLEEHKWIIDAIGVSLIGAFAAEKIVPLIMSIIAGVMNFVSVIKGLIALLTGSGGLIGGIKAIGTVLGTGGIWGIAIGAAIAVGVLLIKNWDKIKAAATRLKEWVVEKTRKLKEDVVNAFMELNEKASNILNIFAEFINTTLDKIKNTTTTIVNAVKDGAINGFNLLKQKVSGIMDSVKTKISSVCTGIKKTFSDVISWIKNTFTDAWSRAWNRVKSIFSNVFNGLSKLVKKPINAVISIVNGAISAINGAISGIESAVSFGPWEIPTPWGTRTIGFSASFPRVPSVPYLASGAVIPPRSEFLAVLGDQKSGNNIEAPESLLRKIVREESGTSPGGGQYRFTAQLNRRTIFDEVIEEAKLRRDLNGQNPFLLT